MSEPTTLVVCPTCKRSCRTRQEPQHRAKMRCPSCDGLFYFVVHGNGAVELRPVDVAPATESAAESRLPPRMAVQGESETRATRKVFTSRRRNRPIGGYAPFEKSRSYIGVVAFWTFLGFGALAACWYFKQVRTITEAQGRTGSNAWQGDIDAKAKDFRERQKKAIANLKKRASEVQVQQATVEVEGGR
jgi:hypothetical protein